MKLIINFFTVLLLFPVHLLIELLIFLCKGGSFILIQVTKMLTGKSQKEIEEEINREE